MGYALSMHHFTPDELMDVTGEVEVSVTLQSFIRLNLRMLLCMTIVVLLAGCGDGSAETAVTPEVTAAAGGMVVPAQSLTETVTTTVALSDTTGVTPAVALLPGQQVRPLTTAVRLYVDANRDAPVMNQYAVEAIFTLLEPSGDYSAYPVEAEGEQWYRVRADDGLVGWTPAEMLTVLP